MAKRAINEIVAEIMARDAELWLTGSFRVPEFFSPIQKVWGVFYLVVNQI